MHTDYWSVQRLHEEWDSHFDEKYDINAHTYRVIEGHRICDGQLVNYVRSKGYLVTPCKLDSKIPFCNLCHDEYHADEQISTGKRNRDIAKNGSFLMIPDHYNDFLMLMERSFSRTFWDDEITRGYRSILSRIALFSSHALLLF